ncbi:MAG: NAD-binding protein, partial [Acidobacteriota bacterium]
MKRSNRRLLLLVLTLPVLVFLAAVLYMWGMEHLEERPRSFLDSLAWSIETFTTTGYGGDHHWDHPVMVAFVGIVQFGGVFLIFLVFPLYLIPFLEERFQARVPTRVREMRDHVVVFQTSKALRSVLEDLASRRIPVLIADESPERSRRALEQGHVVITGQLFEGLLEEAHLGSARVLLANGSDDENVAAILEARHLGFEGDILTLTVDPLHSGPALSAGATKVFTPRHALGEVLAEGAAPWAASVAEEAPHLGEQLSVRQFRLAEQSDLAGRTLGDANLGGDTGAVVLGQWVGGTLEHPLDSRSTLHPGAVIVAAGTERSLDALEDLGGEQHPSGSPVIVAGLGEVGSRVVETLGAAGVHTLTVDRRSDVGAEVVGDVHDGQTLAKLPLADARTLVLALDSDEATLFTTLLMRGLSPTVQIVARVNQETNVERIYRAGADLAVSLSQLTS